MKVLLSLLSIFFVFNTHAESFPTSPDEKMTPGSVCTSPDTYRYPERIAYCSRSVGSNLKATIIKAYDTELGFHIEEMKRSEFKIDHYIPLCMGGSNQITNLWPQHESIYKFTDSLEQLACEKMAQGKLKQEDAIRLIKKAKATPDKAQDVIDIVQAL